MPVTSNVLNISQTGIVNFDGTATFTGIPYASSIAGQVLTSNGSSVPTWQTSAAGNLILIQSQTASNSASLAFTSGITNTYSTYLVVLRNILPVSTANFQMFVSNNGGSSYASSGYRGGGTWTSYNSSSNNNTNATAEFPMMHGWSSSSPTGGGFFYIHNMSTANTLSIDGVMCWNNQESGLAVGFGWVGGTSTTTSVNAIKFQFDAGNISQGTITLFGVLE